MGAVSNNHFLENTMTEASKELNEKIKRLNRITEIATKVKALAVVASKMPCVKELRVKSFGIEGFDSAGVLVVNIPDIPLNTVLDAIDGILDKKAEAWERELEVAVRYTADSDEE